MDLNATLTLYTVSSGLCFALSLMLLVFAQLRQGTLLVRSTAWALIVLAVGFLVAGVAPVLPLWVTVLDTNLVLLMPGTLFYSGLRAFVTQRPARLDGVGVGLIALTVPFFFYWGFVDPNGMRRAVVFSIACSLIYLRISRLMLGYLQRYPKRLSVLTVTLAFAVVSVWMAVRAMHLMLADPLPAEMRAGNPTTWPTVFFTNVMVAVLVASMLATEIGERHQRSHDKNKLTEGVSDPRRDNLALLWGVVFVVLAAIVSELGIGYLVLLQRERQQLQEQNTLANQALAKHGHQLIHQTDLMLRATRNLVQKKYPLGELDSFASGLITQKEIFEGIYLVDAQGRFILPMSARAKGVSVEQRDYFQYHCEHAEDELFISRVAVGQLTGKLQFRLSRRVNDARGQFAGVVLIALEPQAFTQYYNQLMSGSDKMAVLVGTFDHRVRATLAKADVKRMDAPMDSPVWSMLEKADTGDFQNVSPFDGIRRQYHYQKLADVPLVMVTGFSEADVQNNVLRSLKPIALGALLTMVGMLTITYILAASLRRRDEQERFLSMISHELRTPMSVIRMVSGTAVMPTDIRERVVRAINSMSTIIDRAMQADRIWHGRMKTNVTDCDVCAVLHAARLQCTEPARVQLDAEPRRLCQTDPQLLQVVVDNLLDNALKYSPSDAMVHVQVCQQLYKLQRGVAITVSNPPGLAGKPDKRQLFRKFYRAPGAHGKSGSGLGLHISEGLSRLLGGHLKYAESDGKVQFILWIPL